MTSERVYWNGKEFNGRLSAKSWLFFSTLAEKRKTIGRAIDADDLGHENTFDNLKVQKSRCVAELQEQFPDLANLIVPDRYSYRLDLDASRIKIFSRRVTEQVWELVRRSQMNPLAEHSKPN